MTWLKVTTAYTLVGALAFAAVFAVVPTTYAQPAYTINYQGKLTDATGLAVADGSYDMEFKLYAVSNGGTAVWTETRTGGNQVSVVNGLFSVMLGEVASLTSVDFNQPLWLGVNIESDGEMTPRKALGTVPSAFEAQRVGGVASSSFLRSDEADTASGLLTFTGGLVSTASSTINSLTTNIATTTTLVINGEAFTDLTGAGLLNNSGVLTIDTAFLDPRYASTTDFDTSAELAAILTDETGTGSVVFSNSPTFTGTVSGAAASFSGNISAGSFTENGTTLSGQYFKQGGNSFATLATLGTNDANDLTFETNNTRRMTIDASGNVGIGTTSPENLLTIRRNESASAGPGASQLALVSGTGGNVGSGYRVGGIDFLSNDLGNVNTVARIEAVASAAHFGSNFDTDLVFSATTGTTPTEYMRINSEGNVGIGVASPNAKLHVEGSGAQSIKVESSDDTSAALELVRSSGGAGDFQLINDAGTFHMRYGTGESYGSTFFTVNNLGNVGVGDTSPGNKLDVAGNINVADGNAYRINDIDIVKHNSTSKSISVGEGAGNAFNSTGLYNTAIGYQAAFGTGSTTASDFLTVVGIQAGYQNTGDNLVGYGYRAGYQNTGGSVTAVGSTAASGNSGTNIAAIGTNAGQGNTANFLSALGVNSALSNTGVNVSAIGASSAYQNTGTNVSAVGYQSAGQNTGASVSALGVNSAYQNTGTNLTAVGVFSAYQNTGASVSALGVNSAYQNTAANLSAVGYETLRYRNAANSVAVGYQAGYGSDATRRSISNSTFIGYRAGFGITTGSNNLLLGYQAGDALTSGSNNIAIGYDVDLPSATGSNQLNIGNTIYGDLSSGNVGIGTTTPLGKLHVEGAIGGVYVPTNGNKLIFTRDSGPSYIEALGTSGALVLDSRNYTSFNFNGTERIRITASGNVGIGETAPGSRLSVSGGATIGASYDTTAAPTNGLIVEGNVGIGTTNTTGYPLSFAGTAGDKINFFGVNGSTRDYKVGVRTNTLYFNTDQDIDFDQDGATVMSISNGDVAIGDIAPQADLHVYGSTILQSPLATNTLSPLTANTLGNPILSVVNRAASGNYGGMHLYSGGQTSGTYIASSGASKGAWSAGASFFSGSSWRASETVGSALVQDNGVLTYNVNMAQTVGATAAMTELFRINSDGKVGIGTSSPSALLHLQQAANTYTPALSVQGGDNILTVNTDLPGTDITESFVTVGGTFPATHVGNVYGVYERFVSNGSSTRQQVAHRIQLDQGYEGNKPTTGLEVANNTSPTGGVAIGISSSMDGGTNTGSGANDLSRGVGMYSLAKGPVDETVGVWGTSALNSNVSALRVGVAGFAKYATTANIGGYFALHADGFVKDLTPTPFTAAQVSSALVATNGTEAANIFTGYDNETPVFSIVDGGNVGIGTTTPSSKLTVSGNGYITGGLGVGKTNTTAGSVDITGKYLVNGTQVIYSPGGDTIFVGDGGGALNQSGGLAGQQNTAVGNDALRLISTGYRNTAIGYQALEDVNSGTSNVGIGYGAGGSISTGSSNLALGALSMNALSTGQNNVALGQQSLFSAEGSRNVAIGDTALRYYTGNNNITSSVNNVGIGASTKLQADGDTNSIVIGYNATGNGSNSVTLGADTITKTILKGNVGIGVTNPTYALQVQTTGNSTALFQGANPNIIINGSSDGGGRALGFQNAGTTKASILNAGSNSTLYYNADTQYFRPLEGGQAYMSLAASGGGNAGVLKMLNRNTAATTVQIDALGNSYFNTGGNFGIGTVSPATLLSVAGNATIGAGGTGGTAAQLILDGGSGTNGGGYLRFNKNGVTTGFIGQDSAISGGTANDLSISGAANNLRFYAGSSERLRILSTGSVGIGTTTPRGKFDVNSGLNDYSYFGGNAAGHRGVRIGQDASGFAVIQGWGYSPGVASDLTLQNAGGNVGIGTTNPSLLFQVAGRGGMGSDGIFYWGQDLTGNNRGTLTWDTDRAIISTPNRLDFRTNNLDRVTINSSGNVGIGTTNPTSKLVVEGGPIASTVQSNSVNIGTVSGNPAYNFVGYNGFWGLRTNTANAFNLDVYNSAVPKTALTVLQSGNVGIGVSAPGYALDINGNDYNHIRLQGGIPLIKFAGNGYNSGNGAEIYQQSTGNLLFNVNGSLNAILIDSSGNVGINQAAPSTFKLEVGGSVGPSATNSYNLGAAGRNWGCLYYNGGTTGTCASDERLKDDIQTLSFATGSTTALDKLALLDLRSFEYNSAPGSKYHGLIAQEVQAAGLEALVTEADDGYLAVRYGDLQWVVIEAMQDMWKRVQEYFDRTEALEEEVEDLKQRIEDLERGSGGSSTSSSGGGNGSGDYDSSSGSSGDESGTTTPPVGSGTDSGEEETGSSTPPTEETEPTPEPEPEPQEDPEPEPSASDGGDNPASDQTI